MILRRIARPMLATIFFTSGLDAVRNPGPRAEVAGDFIDSSLGALPDTVSTVLPSDPQTLVRLNGALQLGGAVLLATGKFPRLAALGLAATLVPTTFAGHPFWQEADQAKRSAQRTQFYKNVSIAGGLLIASADTAGKPSLAWRGKHAADAAGAAVAAALPFDSKSGASAWDSLVEHTSQSASALAERSESAAERVRERAPEFAEAARERSAEWVEALGERSAEVADILAERAPELADSARSLALTAQEKAQETADAGRRRWRKAVS